MRVRGLRALGLSLMGVVFVAAPAAADDANKVAYRVRPGDTVPRVSWQYRVRADVIRAANHLSSDQLTPGQVIEIPLAPSSPARVAVAVPVAPAAVSIEPAVAVPVETPREPVAVAMAVAPEPAPPPPPPVEFPPSPREGHAPPAPPEPSEERATASDHPDFLGAARRLAGYHLRYSGSWTPPGEHEAWMMDCSNTARYLYRAAAGIELPRTASDQYESLRQARRLWDVPHDDANRPEKLDRFLASRLRPGDLLFWENTYRPVRNPDITHVMVYLGRDPEGRPLMAGSQAADGVSIYHFDPHAVKGGYSAWFGLIHRHGRFVAYGRPMGI